MDRRLAAYRRPGATGRYGRTKPGTLLKQHIPLRTDRWDVTVPGFTEIDLGAHCGESGDGEFAHSLNLTDIHTTWVETRAVLGRGQHAVQQALEARRQTLPFRLQGIDSDNGSEFINAHRVRYCQHHAIQFTRGRPYKKDDNAHIEQKNWTPVRKLVGDLRYDSPEAVAALNALYQHELRLFQNLFLPSVKLVRKTRVGARIHCVYDRPQTPFERVQACPEAVPVRVAHLQHLRATLDPFALAEAIDQQLSRLAALAHRRAVSRMPVARTPTDRSSAAHRSRERRPPSGALRITPSRSGAAPVPAPRQNRVTSLILQRIFYRRSRSNASRFFRCERYAR
jgi:hypothetical protein